MKFNKVIESHVRAVVGVFINPRIDSLDSTRSMKTTLTGLGLKVDLALDELVPELSIY